MNNGLQTFKKKKKLYKFSIPTIFLDSANLFAYWKCKNVTYNRYVIIEVNLFSWFMLVT